MLSIALATVCDGGVGCESNDVMIGCCDCVRFGDDSVVADSLWLPVLRSLVEVVDLEQSTRSERRLSFLSSRVVEFTGLLSSVVGVEGLG